jgi:EF hand
MRVSSIVFAVALGAALSLTLGAQQPTQQGGQQPPQQGGQPSGQPHESSGGGAFEGKVYDVSLVFDAVDSNHDGKITHDEWKAAGFPDQPFNMWCASGQDYLTREGFGSYKHPLGLDTNGDGKMTKAKLLAHIANQHTSGATEGNSQQK